MPRKPPAEPIDHHYNISEIEPRLLRVCASADGGLSGDGGGRLLPRLEGVPANVSAARPRQDARRGAGRARKGVRRGARKAAHAAHGRAGQHPGARALAVPAPPPPGRLEPEDLRRRPDREVPEGLLRRRALQVRERPGQQPQVSAQVAPRRGRSAQTAGRRKPAAGDPEEGRDGHQRRDPAHHRPPRRSPGLHRQALRRLQAGAPEGCQRSRKTRSSGCATRPSWTWSTPPCACSRSSFRTTTTT